MNEFARLVGMEGVARVNQLKQNARNVGDLANPAFSRGIVSSPGLCSDGHAWITGPCARTAPETALERFATEIRDGRHVWVTGIRQDGMMLSLPASSGAASLLCTADRQSLRLMIVGAEGWSFVIHPLKGGHLR